jgi:hypothetical protein
MASGFLGSREFAASAVVALAILGGGGWVLADASTGSIHEGRTACAAIPPTSSTLEARRTERFERDKDVVRRAVSFELDQPPAGGALDLCAAFGGLTVRPSLDGRARVRFTITASGDLAEEAVRTVEVTARFAQGPAGMVLDAHQETHAEASRWFSTRGSDVAILVEVPPEGTYALRATSGAGGIDVEDLRVQGASIEAGFGTLTIRGVRGGGAWDLRTYGPIDASFLSLGNGSVAARTEFGAVHLGLPPPTNVGYDITARTTFGGVTVDVGPTELQERTGDPARGERVHVRTRGYDDKPVRSAVHAEVGKGPITITTA